MTRFYNAPFKKKRIYKILLLTTGLIHLFYPAQIDGATDVTTLNTVTSPLIINDTVNIHPGGGFEINSPGNLTLGSNISQLTTNDGTITNNNIFSNNSPLTNNNVINNTNTSTFNSNQLLENYGTITNSGTINDFGSLRNSGTINNSGTIGNLSTLTFNTGSVLQGGGTLRLYGGTVVSTLDLTIPWAIQVGYLNNRNFIQPASGTTLTLNQLISNYTSQAVNLTFNGAGTTVLSGANTYTGGSVISAGTVRVESDTTVGTGNTIISGPLGTGGITLSGGTLQAGGGNRTLANTFTVSASSTIDNAGNQFTLNGAITNALNQTLKFADSSGMNTGSTILAHPMTNSGTINNQTTLVKNSNFNNNNGTFNNTGTFTNSGNPFNNSGTFNNSGILNSNISFYNYASGSFNNSGTFTNNNIFLNLGPLNLNAGSVLLGSGTLRLNGGTVMANTNVTMPWAVTLPDTSVGASLTATPGNIFTLNGVISNAAGITAPSELQLTGGGSFQVNGASTFSGGSAIGEVGTPTTVTMGHADALGTGSISLFGGSTLNPYNGSLTLTSTRSLSGVGLMAGNVVNNGGVLYPGYILDSYGVMQLGGTYTGSGTLEIALKPSAAPVSGVDYNALDLGNHNFDAHNTTLNLVPEGGVYAKGAQYHFITTTGNVNGAFLNDQSLPNFGPYKPVISYNAAAGGGAALTIEMTRIYLTDALGGVVDAQSFPAANYFDQQDNLSSDSTLGRIIGALDDLEGKALDRALDSFVPEETDDATYLFLESTHSAHRVHQSRLGAQRAFRRGSITTGASTSGFASTVSRGQTYNQKMLASLTSKSSNNVDVRAMHSTRAGIKSEMDEAMHNSVAESMGRGGYWTHAFGSMTRQNNSGDDVGFKAQTGGILVGGDVKLSPNTFFGVSGGYTKTLMKMNENGGTHHLDSYMMSLYGTWFDGPFALDYSLTGSVNVYNLVRRVVIPGNPDSDVASMHNGYEISPFVGLSYEFNADDLRITPFLNGSFTATKERGYRENGGLVDQQVRSRNSYFLATEIGLTFSEDFVLEDKMFTPSLKLGYSYKKPIRTGSIVASFAGATGTYSVSNTNKAIHEFTPSLEGTLRWKDGLYLGASYSAELSKNYKVHELTLKLGKRF